jgi:hypothetical protein
MRLFSLETQHFGLGSPENAAVCCVLLSKGTSPSPSFLGVYTGTPAGFLLLSFLRLPSPINSIRLIIIASPVG